jgi:hypothetical protein
VRKRLESNMECITGTHTKPASPGILLIDSDDAEGWLVDEGIGYFDSSGMFHYGDDPAELMKEQEYLNESEIAGIVDENS